jgi:hypothetical protein
MGSDGVVEAGCHHHGTVPRGHTTDYVVVSGMADYGTPPGALHSISPMT